MIPGPLDAVVAHRVPLAFRDPRTGRVRIVEEAAATPVRVPYVDPEMGRVVRLSLGARTEPLLVYGQELWQPLSCRVGQLGTAEGDAKMTLAPFRPHLRGLLALPGSPEAARARPDPDEAAGMRVAASEAVRAFAARDLGQDGTYLYLRLPRPVLVGETSVGSVMNAGTVGPLNPGVPPELVPAYREVAGLLAPFGKGAAIPPRESGSMERAWAKFEEQAGRLPADDRWLRRLANVLPIPLVEALQDPRRGRLAGEAARQVGRLAPFLGRGALGALPEDHLAEALSACVGAAATLAGLSRQPLDRNRYAFVAAFAERVALPALWAGRTLAREDAAELAALAP